jgi:hypothetical protein
MPDLLTVEFHRVGPVAATTRQMKRGRIDL